MDDDNVRENKTFRLPRGTPNDVMSLVDNGDAGVKTEQGKP